MTDDLPHPVRALLDRSAIVECLHRYCRGINRLDATLVQSAFHDDARICTGDRSDGIADFIEQYWNRQADTVACQHYVSNVTADVSDRDAHVETYFFSSHRRVDDVQLIGGRYVDRFEYRDQAWKIALRVVIREWSSSGHQVEALAGLPSVAGRRDRSDPSYERPLRPR
jgi:hypothetical protein